MSIIQNLSQTSSAYVIDGKSLNLTDASAKPLELKAGSSIQGTVVSVTDVDGEKVANISIGDSVISAKLSDEMGLREGQTLNFAVKSTTNGKVSITPLYENTAVSDSALKALSAAGVEINRDTVEMVKNMMEAGLPIGRDSLLSMNKNLTMYPNSSISTMVEMKSLGIPINDNNILQFESYKNYEHQVLGQIRDFVDELPNAFNELAMSGNDDKALQLYGAVLKELSNGAEVTENTQQEGIPPTAENAGKDLSEAISKDAAANLSGEIIENEEAAAKPGVNVLPDSEAISDAAVKPQSSQVASENSAVISEEGIKEGAVLSSEGKVIEGTADAAKDNLAGNLKALNLSDEVFKEYVRISKSDPGEAARFILKELNSSFEMADLTDKTQAAAWKGLFTSPEYNKILKDGISEQWLLKPGDVEKKENIDNLYQRLNSQMKGLAAAIGDAALTGSKLSQTVTNIQNNLDFMNQLNQMFQYVQLPLQMSGQNAHGDLYVYRNKNKKFSEDGSVSAVLHLDMEHLGPVDVYVKMLENKVTTNFYVADDSVLDLINDNIHILNERLEKRGYSMKVNMMLHDDKDGEDAAVDEMLSVSKKTLISTTSFDARA